MIKQFNEYYVLNEDLGYTDFFQKKISHKQALETSIRDLITMIITTEKGISEKSFQKYDQIIEKVKNICENNLEIYDIAQEFYENNKRLEFAAESIYDKFFKNIEI
jgi:hypothetical protein